MQESVRLRRTLRGLGVPIDVVVFGQEKARRRSAARGTVVERALRDGSSLTLEELEEARRLLKTARSDLRAAETLAPDAQQENDVVGFQSQQAVEKSIKRCSWLPGWRSHTHMM
jgi:hypothetical protein